MRKILIYNPQPCVRTNYVLGFVFDSVLEWNWEETNKYDVFFNSGDIRINYSGKNIEGVFNIPAGGFLNEKKLFGIEPGFEVQNGLPVLFPEKNGRSVDFDLFAAVFYMISRYEEYFQTSRDLHGRFPSRQSLSYRMGFHNRPVVDEWIYFFAAELQKMFPDVTAPSRSFVFQPTVDIDNAFAFKHKGLLRSAGGYFRSLIQFDFNELAYRTQVLIGKRKDPYDTLNYVKNIHRQYSLNPIIFILGGVYGKFDKNISYRNRHFRKLIIEAHTAGVVGLHPSYISSEKGDLLHEKNMLEKIHGNAIRNSRQHFLMISLPETYRRLYQAGIENDFSMGFSDLNGFRAGTCTPFYFYDLVDECRRDILIFPFQIIDVAFMHQNMSREDAVKEIEEIIDRIKQVNGLFIPVWHNESLGNYKKWAGWKEVYQRLIKLAVQKTDPYE